jgi:hypothetical protein
MFRYSCTFFTAAFKNKGRYGHKIHNRAASLGEGGKMRWDRRGMHRSIFLVMCSLHGGLMGVLCIIYFYIIKVHTFAKNLFAFIRHNIKIYRGMIYILKHSTCLRIRTIIFQISPSFLCSINKSWYSGKPVSYLSFICYHTCGHTTAENINFCSMPE